MLGNMDRSSEILITNQLNCTITTIGASTCELTDLVCIKANEKMLADLSVCVKASCTIKEALSMLL
jgi:hypothetical protein